MRSPFSTIKSSYYRSASHSTRSSDHDLYIHSTMLSKATEFPAGHHNRQNPMLLLKPGCCNFWTTPALLPSDTRSNCASPDLKMLLSSPPCLLPTITLGCGLAAFCMAVTGLSCLFFCLV